jgi:hypothetical protein
MLNLANNFRHDSLLASNLEMDLVQASNQTNRSEILEFISNNYFWDESNEGAVNAIR